jgi:hypothetical protein
VPGTCQQSPSARCECSTDRRRAKTRRPRLIRSYNGGGITRQYGFRLSRSLPPRINLSPTTISAVPFLRGKGRRANDLSLAKTSSGSQVVDQSALMRPSFQLDDLSPIPPASALVRRMAAANPLWGAPRIHAELLKLGLDLCERTVSRLMPKRRTPPSQTWRAFLANHVRDLVSFDFFTVPTAGLRVPFVLVVLAPMATPSDYV